MRVADSSRTFSTQGDIERFAPDRTREVYLKDSKRSNLVVRVSPKGAKTFYFHRTDPTRKSGTAKVRIGPVGEWTLAQARDEVDHLNGRTVAGGGAVPKRERPSGVTLGDACRDYMAWHLASGGRSHKDHESMFRLYLEPLGHVLMDAIDEDWVEQHVKFGVANAGGLDGRREGLRRSGGHYIANKTLAFLSAVYGRYLKVNKLAGRRQNPCRGVDPFPKTRREECLRGDEIRRFMAAIDDYKREHGYYKHTRPGRGMFEGEPIESKLALADLILVCLVTGQRRGAVASMKWADLRMSGTEPVWRIPPDAGNKSRTVKTVALHPRIVELLRDRRKRIEGDYVFPGARGAKRAVDPRKAFHRIREMAGIDNPDLRLHDLRASFVTLGIASGMNLEAISAAVGHSDIATTRHYARLSDAQRRDVATGIGDLMFAEEGSAN